MSAAGAPIGVFDSGVGGLSVLRQIRAALPREDLIYVADSGHAPYGCKPPEFVEGRALAIGEFLRAQGVKALVVACNTATAAAVPALRARHDCPVVGVEPAVKPAVEATRSGVIGVLATTGTLSSDRFASLVERFGARARVVVQPCPGLVERVEQGDWSSVATRALVERYVRPLLGEGADTLVLGCTHYPFVADLIRDIAGPEVAVIDTGAAVSRQLARVLAQGQLLLQSSRRGEERFWTSGDSSLTAQIVARLWQRPARVEALPAAFGGR